VERAQRVEIRTLHVEREEALEVQRRRLVVRLESGPNQRHRAGLAVLLGEKVVVVNRADRDRRHERRVALCRGARRGGQAGGESEEDDLFHGVVYAALREVTGITAVSSSSTATLR